MQENQTVKANIQQWYDRLPLVARVDRPYPARPEKLTILRDSSPTSMQITTKPNTFQIVYSANGTGYNMKCMERADQNLDVIIFGKVLDERNMPELLFLLQKDISEVDCLHPSNSSLRTIPLDALVDYRI
ncbi:hypothetical protein HYX06_04405 [Candidatus Woesearchaeota archaeon]|nr:hypothetical protein [Candidatus Woesearchaeota archaeon]